MQPSSNDPAAAGTRPPGRTEGTRAEATPHDDFSQLQDAESARLKALMDMLIDDARNGRVKDPEERNVKGRHGKKIAVTKGARKSPQDVSRSRTNSAEADQAKSAERLAVVNEASNEASNHQAEQSASTAIKGASAAIKGLKKALSVPDDAEGVKIVQLHLLV